MPTPRVMGEMIRLYYASNMRLWRARQRGTLTDDEFRARQKAINDWLGVRGISMMTPNDTVLARGRMPIVYSVDPPAA
jgi:hypothetical protein